MEVDLDFSCFNFDQHLPPTLGSSEELRDDAQHEILMGYPIYTTLLKNLQIMKKALDDKTKFIKKLKTSKQQLVNEIQETKSKLVIAHEDVDRISDNLKIQIEQHVEDKEKWQIELDANRSYIEQLELLPKITDPIQSCASPKKATEVVRRMKPPSVTLKSKTVQTDATPSSICCKCQQGLQLSLDEEHGNYEPLQHLESPISLDYDPSDRGELESELMHAAEQALTDFDNYEQPVEINLVQNKKLSDEEPNEFVTVDQVCSISAENNTQTPESIFEEPVTANECDSDDQVDDFVEPIVFSPVKLLIAPSASVKKTYLPAVSKLKLAEPEKTPPVALEPVVTEAICETSDLSAEPSEETPKKIVQLVKKPAASNLQNKLDSLFGPISISPNKPLITPITPMKICLVEAPSLKTTIAEIRSSSLPPKSCVITEEIILPPSPEELNTTDTEIPPCVEEFSSPSPQIPRFELTPPPEEDFSPASPDPEPVEIPTPPKEIPTENSDREFNDILQQLILVPTLIEPMSPESRPAKRKIKRSSQEPARKIIVLEKQKKIVKQVDEEIPSLFDARALEIISRPLSPLLCHSDEEPEPKIITKPTAKVPEKKSPSFWEIDQFRKRINPGAFVAANKIYKEHLECLTVRDEQFSREMLADIFTRLATLPPSISTETLAKALLLPILKCKSATLIAGAKPCPMSSVEQRTLFVVHRLEKNCARWSRLSSAASKEALKLLLTSRKPKHLNCFDVEVVNPMLSRLITSVSLLAKDPGMARTLLQLSSLYLPLEAPAIGLAVLGAWPQVLHPKKDVQLLRHMWHSSSPDHPLRRLLDATFRANFLTLDDILPFELFAPG